MLYTDSNGVGESALESGGSTRYDPMGRAAGFPQLTWNKPSKTNPWDPVAPKTAPSDPTGGGCQLEVDGIETPCSAITPETVQLEVRYGNKVRQFNFSHELPGNRVFSVWIPTYNLSLEDYPRLEEAGIDPADLLGQGTTISFVLPGSSWNVAQQQNDKFKVDIPANPKDDTSSLLKNPDCAAFINRLVNKAAELTGVPFANDNTQSPVDYLLNNLDKVKYNDGAFVNQKGEEFPYPTAIGSFNTNPTVYMRRKPLELMSLEKWKSTGNTTMNWLNYSVKVVNSARHAIKTTALHETLHLLGIIGAYGDPDFARAIAALNGDGEWKKQDGESDFDFIKRSSIYWNGALYKHCN